MLGSILERIAVLQISDYLIIAANILLLVFAGPLSLKLQGLSGSQSRRNRMLVMRFFSLVLILIYLVSLIFGFYFGIDGAGCRAGADCLAPFFRNLSQTGITLLVSYFAVFLAQAYIVRKFGRTREIEGEAAHLHTYQSELLSMVVLLAVIIVAFLTVLSIWEIDDWKQQTGVIGGILLLLFITKDIWLPDNINGLILLYQSDVEPGAVVRVESLGLLAVALRTSLTQTVFRDLVQRHRIIVPNSRFRDQKIEVLTLCPDSGLVENLDFKIGYEVPPADVDEFLITAWRNACEVESALNEEVEGRIFVVDNGDHAVTYRLRYVVKTVYRLMQARFALCRSALELSRSTGIGLNTPITYTRLDDGEIRQPPPPLPEE